MLSVALSWDEPKKQREIKKSAQDAAVQQAAVSLWHGPPHVARANKSELSSLFGLNYD